MNKLYKNIFALAALTTTTLVYSLSLMPPEEIEKMNKSQALELLEQITPNTSSEEAHKIAQEAIKLLTEDIAAGNEKALTEWEKMMQQNEPMPVTDGATTITTEPVPFELTNYPMNADNLSSVALDDDMDDEELAGAVIGTAMAIAEEEESRMDDEDDLQMATADMNEMPEA